MSSIISKLSINPKADFFGGLTAAVTALPLAIAFGVMVTNEIGPEWSSVGAVAGLYGAIFTGFFASFLGGTPSQITGPTGPMTTVLAGVVATLVARFGTMLKGEEILLAAFLSVVFCGLIQIGLGVARLGGLVKYIPYPVTAGFMNGIAVIIFLGQRKPFVGMEDGVFDPATTVVGLVTVAIIMLTPRVTKMIPGSLAGLGLGTALYYGIRALRSETVLGPVVGQVPTAIPSLENIQAFLHFPSHPHFSDLLPIILSSALSLAILGAIDSLLTSVVADTVTKTRHDSNRELIGQGIGNATAGIFGGFAGAGATIRTLVNINAGGSGRLSGMIHSLLLLLVVLMLGSTAGKIPNVVLSAILMVTAWGMLDRWSGGLVKRLTRASQNRQEILVNLGLVVVVTVVTVTVDLMVAVGVGLVLASLYFVGRTGETAVRGIYTGENVHSRRTYPLQAQNILEMSGEEILIVELQGPLFFGSADQFLRKVEEHLTPGIKRVILDLHRITGIDSSGGLAIAQLQDRLKSSERRLAISGLRSNSDHWSFLHDLGIVESVTVESFFADLDRALEWCEVSILEAEGSFDGSYDEQELATMDIFEHFSSHEFKSLQRYLEPVALEPGAYLFKKGDSADAIYLITQGAVHLYVGDDPETGERLSHFGPGSTIGEVSMLVGGLKTSNAIVDLPLKAFRLTRVSLDRLQRETPMVASRLLWALGRELSQRVSLLRKEIYTIEK